MPNVNDDDQESLAFADESEWMDDYEDPDDYTSEAGVQERLEYLRGELRAERISYSELHELQSLAPYIEAGDTELLEWAGVPEFPDD